MKMGKLSAGFVFESDTVKEKWSFLNHFKDPIYLAFYF